MTSLKAEFFRYGHYSLVALFNNGLNLDICKYILSILYASLNNSLSESLSINKIYSGCEFNRICKNINAKMYMFVGVGWNIGLNIASIFDVYKRWDICGAVSCSGGFYFNAGDIYHKWLFDTNTKLALFEIPDDARVFVKKNELKLDKVMVKTILNACDVDDYDFWIGMTNKNGLVLEFVKNQTDEICKSAVRQNGNALQYVKNQTDAICKLAVQRDALAIVYVENKTDDIFELAEKHASKPSDLKFIRFLKQKIY